jgi:hypothetical protein
LDIFYPVAPQRGRHFVAATRVFSALRQHLKCVPTGERGPVGEYWLTPKGVRFPVRDPMTRNSSPIVSVADRRSLCFPYDYAYAVLAHASWLVAHAVPEDLLRAEREAPVPDAHIPAAHVLHAPVPPSFQPPPYHLPDLVFV